MLFRSFGGAPVAGARRFALAAALNAIDLTQVTALQAPFAPAQFFAMSDDDKLAAPSFELMDAGLVIGDGAVHFDEIVAAPLTYDAIVVDTMPQPSTAPKRYTLTATLLMAHVNTGAAARAPVRQSGLARFARPDAAPAATVNPIRWTIVALADGNPPALDPTLRTWADYRSTLASLNRAGSQWQMVPTHELAAA